MSPIRRLRQFLEHPAPDVEAIDAFLRDHTFPIIDGRTVTFVYRGPGEAITLRHWVYGLPSHQAFTRVGNTDLWHLTLELPEQSRVEYKIEVTHHGQATWIRDPLNPHAARDPYGANSVCQVTGYETPEWVHPDPEARPGQVESLTVPSAAFGDERQIEVYLPPRYHAHRRYPLLVVHDGRDYLEYAQLRTVLDNLIYRQEIPQLIVALTSSADRLVEYANDERHARHIVEEVLPAVEARYPIRSAPAERGIMGASFGAVASLSTAWRYPGVFGRVLVQSGSFAFTDIGVDHERGPVFDPVVRFMNAFRDEPGRPTDWIFVSCGTYESLIYENRSLIPLLQGTGMNVRYVEARDGHNWENWRDRLREALAWLFPGPLWMVYE